MSADLMKDGAILMQVLAVVSGFIGAGLWYRASRIKTPQNFPIHVVKPTSAMPLNPIGGVYVGSAYSLELSILGESLMLQNRWNSWAAIATAVSIICQITATFCQSLATL